MDLLIDKLKRNAETGVVESIAWIATKTSTDGKVQVQTQGEQILAPKSPDDLDFVKYYEVTQDTADSWLRQSFKDSGLNSLDEYLSALLEQKVAPKFKEGVPWEQVRSTLTFEKTEPKTVDRQSRLSVIYNSLPEPIQ